MGYQWSDVREVGIQLLRVHVEEGQGADARGIGHPAAHVQRDELRHNGGMTALASGLAHLPHP